MAYHPPFVPGFSRKDDSLQDRIRRARRTREDAAARVEERYAKIKPDERKWRVREKLTISTCSLHVR